MQTKTVQTFEYGNTQGSKIEAQDKSTVRLWAVNKITDATNNTINYVYDEDNENGQHTPNRINYAHNSVRFEYEGRTDKTTTYQVNSKLSQTKRLTNIASYVNNSMARVYNLGYRSIFYAELTSVQACLSSGFCLPKTNFRWNIMEYKNLYIMMCQTNGNTILIPMILRKHLLMLMVW